MTGKVDSEGRALVPVRVRPIAGSPPAELIAWIETAFTGELVMPRGVVRRLALPKSADVSAILADGTQVFLESYTCIVDWFNETRLCVNPLTVV